MKLLQDDCYKFIGQLERMDLYREQPYVPTFDRSGLKVPHIKFKQQELLICHLQKCLQSSGSNVLVGKILGRSNITV